MALHIVMDHTGDTRHEFDPANAAEVKEAMQRFEELVGAGFTAAKKTGEGTAERIKAFDPAAEETLFFPRLKGG